MNSWTFSRLKHRGAHRCHVLGNRLAIEALEQRWIPAALIAAPDAYLSSSDAPLFAGPTGHTSLTMQSDFGDYIGQGKTEAFDSTTGSFRTNQRTDSFAEFAYESVPGNDLRLWYLRFAAPSGSPLGPGVFADATRWPFQLPTVPGMDISGDGRGSNTLTGSFQVFPIEGGSNGQPSPFHATFVQHSEGAVPALRGEFFFHAPAGKPGVLANDTPGDTTARRAILTSAPSHGRVVLLEDGSFTYHPDRNFSGIDRFRYAVTDGARTSAPASVTIDVKPRLQLTKAIPDVVAGKSPEIRVVVRDANGHAVTDDSAATVTLEVASGPGAISGTTSAKVVHGIATFPDAALKVAGQYTLRLRSGDLIETTNPFKVNPAAPARMTLVSQPSQSQAGRPIAAPITVVLLDAFGNVATTPTARKVAIAVASGPGGFSTPRATLAPVAAGTATFLGLVLERPGTYAFRLTSRGLPTLVSDPFLSLASTSVSLRAVPSRAMPDTPLSLVAGVTFERPAIGTAAGGTVTFLADGNLLGTAPLIGGRATLKLKGLTAGVSRLTAIYSGTPWSLGGASNGLVRSGWAPA
ncbi:MAG: Ig-like domain-containing protein [Planctomycetia bacterium]